MSQSNLSREQLEALVGCKIKVKPNGTQRSKKGGLTVATLKRIDGNKAYFVPSGHRREEVCNVKDIVYWPKGMHFNQTAFQKSGKLFSKTLSDIAGIDDASDAGDPVIDQLAEAAARLEEEKRQKAAEEAAALAEEKQKQEKAKQEEAKQEELKRQEELKKQEANKPPTTLVATTSAEALVVCTQDFSIFWNSEGRFVSNPNEATMYLNTRGANVARSLIGKNYKNGSDKRYKWHHILSKYTLIVHPLKSVPICSRPKTSFSKAALEDQYYIPGVTKELEETPLVPTEVQDEPAPEAPSKEAVPGVAKTAQQVAEQLLEQVAAPTPQAVIPPVTVEVVKTKDELLEHKLQAVISARNSVLTAEIMLHEEQIKLSQAEAEYDLLLQQTKLEQLRG